MTDRYKKEAEEIHKEWFERIEFSVSPLKDHAEFIDLVSAALEKAFKDGETSGIISHERAVVEHTKFCGGKDIGNPYKECCCDTCNAIKPIIVQAHAEGRRAGLEEAAKIAEKHELPGNKRYGWGFTIRDEIRRAISEPSCKEEK